MGFQVADAYRKLFKDHGSSFSWKSPDETTRAIDNLALKISSSPVKDYIVEALDDWAIAEAYGARVIWEVTAKVTGQKWREGLRNAPHSWGQILALTRNGTNRRSNSPRPLLRF